jgi:hypothetical protein
MYKRRERGDHMNIGEMLDELKRKALKDPKIRERLLLSREEENPLSAFCAVCRDLGYEIYDMDLLQAGEEAYAAMRRSTNGGGENSPLLSGEDDYYEMFFSDL